MVRPLSHIVNRQPGVDTSFRTHTAGITVTMDRMFSHVSWNKKLFMVLALIVSHAVFPGVLLAETSPLPYRFPDVYNPNPVAGRIFIQPLGVHDHRVLEKGEISVSYGSATDYNVHFLENPGDEELTVNTNVYSLTFAHGVDVLGAVVEFGGVFRSHQDMRETWGSNLVKNYHEAFPSDGFGHVPPDGQYYGAVGNNDTPVIGESREFYLHTLQLHAKYQLLKEESGRPLDLAFKFSLRVPLSSKTFDRAGYGLTAGCSKTLIPGLRLIGSVGLAYQDIDKQDFNADNLDVTPFIYDLFAGLLWDMGEPEAWYVQAGMRYASERVAYFENPESADPAVVAHFGPVYRFKQTNGRTLEWFLSCSEDIPGLGYGLEPDVSFYTGISILFR